MYIVGLLCFSFIFIFIFFETIGHISVEITQEII